MRGIFGEKRRASVRPLEGSAEQRAYPRRSFVRYMAVVLALIFVQGAIPQRPTPPIRALLDAAQSAAGARAKLHGFIGAMESAHSAGDAYGEAEGAFYAGKATESLFDWNAAIRYLKRAAALYQAAGARRDLGVALHEVGRAFDSSGDRHAAIVFLVQALAVERAIDDRDGEGSTLLAIGQVYDERGERQQALSAFTKALAILRTTDPRKEAVGLNYIGRVYEELGRRQKALSAFRKALPLFARLHDDRGRAETLTNIGLTYDNLGKQRLALGCFGQALPLWREDRSGRSATLNDIGKAEKELGDYGSALGHYGQALRIRRDTGDLPGQAITLNNIGRVYVELGRSRQALEEYAAALPLERQTGEREAEAITLRNCAYAIAKLKLTRLAIAYGKQSVNLFQLLRTDLNGMSGDIKRSYASQVRPAFRFLADLLISEGRLAEAQEVLDLLKDDEYFTFIRSSKPEDVDLTKGEVAWKSKYDALGDELAKEATEFNTLERLPTLEPVQVARRAALELKLQAARQAYQAFLKGAQEAFTGADADRERLENLKTYSQLAAIVRAMPTRTAAMYTLVTQDGVRTILTLPDVTELRSSPRQKIGFATLSRKISLLRTTLTDPRLDPIPLASELYDLLILPLRKELADAGARSLMVSLDGPLRYLPLAALYDSRAKQWLCQEYSTSLFTPANLLKMNAAPAPAIRAAGFGVTLAHDVESLRFPALKGVHAELLALQKSLGATIFEDARFTADALKNELRKGDNLVHLATHFELRSGDASTSFLLLGDGKPLPIAEFSGWRQDVLEGVDLFVVSACDTATPSADGGEFESFARAAQENGAAAVLATLWPVNDLSTELFMAHLYGMRKANPRMTKTEAIRQSQVWIMNGSAGEFAAAMRAQTANASPPPSGMNLYHRDPAHPFAHPYFWAPFVLTGNVK